MKRFLESKNKQLQNIEEDMAMHWLSMYLQIPYDSIIRQESPDCLVRIAGKKFGIEITTIRPSMMVTASANNRMGQNKNAIENVVKGICYECMQRYNIYDISINFRLNMDLYFTRYNIKEKKNVLFREIDELFQKFSKYITEKQNSEGYTIGHYSYSSEFLTQVEIAYYPKAGWKSRFDRDKSSINICFTYLGILSPIPFEYVKPFILKKEQKIDWYRKNNPNIEEMWLCLFLPNEEFAFTIKGIEVPINHKSSYDRVILVQESPPFVRDL